LEAGWLLLLLLPPALAFDASIATLGSGADAGAAK
jgi:hypothetical protein